MTQAQPPLVSTSPIADLASDPSGQRLTLARTLAVAAARRTLRWFRGPVPYASSPSALPVVPGDVSLSIDCKADGSPVTLADRDAEQYLKDHIRQAYPDDAILGEELGESPGTSAFRWILDPIDGTFSFIHGVPLFGTLIAIEHENRPVAGVIVLPALDEILWGGPAFGAFHELGTFSGFKAPTSTPARTSTTSSIAQATVATTSLNYFTKAGIPQTYAAVEHACHATRGWSDCYALVLAATGRIDAVVEPLVKPWDVAAIVPIIEAAGGKCTDFNGERSTHTGNCVVSNGSIHDELLRVIASNR